ncbi:MAG: DUF5985 family protein [Candidatus Binatia bacterium]
MAETIYIACAITSVLCAILLVRGYRRRRNQLLLWSSLCFIFLALNNVLLFVDLVLVPTTADLSIGRHLLALTGLGLLVYGLVWDTV